MINAINDERDWNIKVVINKKNCPYLFYQDNIYVCKNPSLNMHKSKDFIKCKLENCLLRWL